MAGSRDLDPSTAARGFGAAYFNLLRRGADGSLVLSADHWRLDGFTTQGFRFVARDPGAPPLTVPSEMVARLTWDQLPRQRARSQIRFALTSGDVWTFSGQVDETAFTDPPPATGNLDETR